MGSVICIAKRVRVAVDKHPELAAGRCIVGSRVLAAMLRRQGVNAQMFCGEFEGNNHCWVETPIGGVNHIVDITASDFNKTKEEVAKIKLSRWYTEDYKKKVTPKSLPDVLMAPKAEITDRFTNGWTNGVVIPPRTDPLTNMHRIVMRSALAGKTCKLK